jgi:hypothetical protein
MSEVRQIEVRRRDLRIEKCHVVIADASPWHLVFSGAGRTGVVFEGRDLFEALAGLRSTLEAAGDQLLCNGARRDVFPSGMSRSMGGGRKAYVLRLGTPAKQGDLVDLFDPASPDLVGTVDKQREFRDAWLVSIRASADGEITPRPGEIDEARRNPGGWVYRIAGDYGPDDRVPPEAVVGAWKVDTQGKIVGNFVKNEKYRPT